MTADSRILWLPNGYEERGDMAWDDAPSSSSRNPAGVRIDPDTAVQSTVVLACARVLAESVASLPLHLYRRAADRSGKSIAREHPLYRRLHTAPNSWQTSFEWREQQVFWMALWGNSYNEIRPGASGAVDELWPMHPSRMKVERVENGRLRYKFRDEKGTEAIYSQDQIMHIRWMSDDGINGMVPVELARDAIGLARACEIHGARYFGNGARPGVVLVTPNEMKAETASQLRDNWERMHRGADRSSKTAVLTGGLDAKELTGASNQESQFLETRRFQIEEICRIFRVPPHLVGDLTRSSFSNIEQQSIDFLQHSLLPWLRRFETAFERDLITDESMFAEFDTRGFLRGDATMRASYYQTLYNLGVASINEIRGWESLDPVDGGDERFVQLNMQTLTAATAAAAAPGPAPDAGGPGAVAAPAEAEPPPQEASARSDKPLIPEEVTIPSLNGGQVSSLLEILTQVTAGGLTAQGARAIIAASFPSISGSLIEQIVSGVPSAEPQGLTARARPGTVSVGDFVSWGANDSRARGKIVKIVSDGKVNVPDSSFEIEGAEDDPAALIALYEKVEGGWRETETKVGHKVSTLTKIDPLEVASDSGRKMMRAALAIARESRSLTVSIDFDGTFAAAPALWTEFVRSCREAGNNVLMITRREDTPENREHVSRVLGDAEPLLDTVIFAGLGKAKKQAADEAGVTVDIWIDDVPSTVG